MKVQYNDLEDARKAMLRLMDAAPSLFRAAQLAEAWIAEPAGIPKATMLRILRTAIKKAI